MTYSKLICSTLFLLSFTLLSCSTNSTTDNDVKSISRPNYIIKYLEDNKIPRPEEAYVFILYTDRCQTCSDDNIDYIINSFSDKNNIFILNFSHEELENKLSSNGSIFIDPYDELSKYGLNSVDNQFFYIKKDSVIFNSLINDATKDKIEEKIAIHQ